MLQVAEEKFGVVHV